MTERTNIDDQVFFSIVVPTYNRAGLISKTIRSLLDQEYQNFEIIVIDDGSTDETQSVVKNISSEKIFYYKINNSERGFARNYGAHIAKGDYLNFFDSDDLALPNHLSVAFNAVLVKDHPEVFHFNYQVMHPDASVGSSNIGQLELANGKLIHGNILSCNGVFLKKQIAMDFPFRDRRSLSASEDWDLWLRLAARFKIHLIPEVTSYIVNHEQRSVMMFNEERSLNRINELIESLKSDPVFIKTFPEAISIIEAHMYSYMSLHAAMANYKKSSFRYLLKALKVNFRELFTRRFLAIVKHLIF